MTDGLGEKSEKGNEEFVRKERVCFKLELSEGEPKEIRTSSMEKVKKT